MDHFIDSTYDINHFLSTLDNQIEHTIYLSKGIYRQKVKITLNHIKLVGESKTETIIVHNDYSYKLHDDGLLYNTFRTATLTITGNHCSLENLTISNDAGSHYTIGQAIALSIYGDQTKIVNCILNGNQDTLFLGPLPTDLIKRYDHILASDELTSNQTTTYIENSTIIGNVDFIFGGGNALFNQCDLVINGSGYIAAPSTYENEIGFVFLNCRLSKLHESDTLILARPWRNFGRTTFIHTTYKSSVDSARYHDWDKENFDFIEYPYIYSPLSKPLESAFINRINSLFNVVIDVN